MNIGSLSSESENLFGEDALKELTCFDLADFETSLLQDDAEYDDMGRGTELESSLDKWEEFE